MQSPGHCTDVYEKTTNCPTKLTSKVSNLDDNEFLASFFVNISDVRQKNVTLLIDEIYVKPSLTYQGGNIFVKAVNKPLHMAKTVLSFMICCMFGGKQILYKALPVFRLDAEFQYQQTLLILNGIRNSGGTVIVILCDNNRVNQNFFKRFDCVTPWRTRDNIFLLFNYVHLLKSIRNNWLTEKSQQLIFVDNGEQNIAKWGTLKKLHSLESGALVKLSKLNE